MHPKPKKKSAVPFQQKKSRYESGSATLCKILRKLAVTIKYFFFSENLIVNETKISTKAAEEKHCLYIITITFKKCQGEQQFNLAFCSNMTKGQTHYYCF